MGGLGRDTSDIYNHSQKFYKKLYEVSDQKYY